MTNRLAQEKSPYLLQHAENPVDWLPWGPEAFEKARRENKPILLSVGYAACHWCHVMAHESFEDEETARVLNERYVPVKVDREERPDVDQVYMAACQAMTGQGGWPLTVFLTPEGKPFYAGTYFPKTGRQGLPGFIQLLTLLHDKWQSEEATILKAAEQLTSVIQDQGASVDGRAPDQGALERGAQGLIRAFDPRHGGFGQAPKFPTPHNISFLLRRHKADQDPQTLEAAVKTLNSMRRGGIFDHIGFGFHRYSVDERWLVPHFEKMLYDQALLALAYLDGFQVSGNPLFSRTAGEIFDYVLRDMTDEEGGFFAAEDADSEGREGLFYLWKPEQVHQILGPDDGEVFSRFFNIIPGGNFEDGLSIPHITVPPDFFAKNVGMSPDELNALVDRGRRMLFEEREKRIHPLKDDKILTSWNGLMIAALARGAQVLGDERLLKAAQKAADFILTKMRTPKGTLYRRCRHGEAAVEAFQEDYAYLVWGLLELYEAGFDLSCLEQALELNDLMISSFRDDKDGAFFLTGSHNEALPARRKDFYDGAIPSGNSVAASNILRLARMTGRTDLQESVDKLMAAFSPQVEQYAGAHTHFLATLDFALNPSLEIVLAGDPDDSASRELLMEVRKKFLPRKTILNRPQDPGKAERLIALAPFAKEMGPVQGRPALYICRNFACQQPISDPAEAGAALV